MEETPSATPEDNPEKEDYWIVAVRGPASEPRATRYEQWIVTVRMIADLRQIDVRVDPPRWEALKEGDRVFVTYRQGKYTGTVWDAKIR